MRWLLAPLAFLLIMAPLIGLFLQPFAPWWLAGSSAPQPIVGVPAGNLPLADVPPAIDAPAPVLSADILMQTIAPYLGASYVFGGCAVRGIDCSCFTMQVMAKLGMSLPRTAQAQFNATQRVEQPRYGDLVFFQHTYDSPDRITHVGIYIGGGQMISAIEPTLGRQSLDSAYWRAHLAGFGRPRGAPPLGQA